MGFRRLNKYQVIYTKSIIEKCNFNKALVNKKKDHIGDLIIQVQMQLFMSLILLTEIDFKFLNKNYI